MRLPGIAHADQLAGTNRRPPPDQVWWGSPASWSVACHGPGTSSFGRWLALRPYKLCLVSRYQGGGGSLGFRGPGSRLQRALAQCRWRGWVTIPRPPVYETGALPLRYPDMTGIVTIGLPPVKAVASECHDRDGTPGVTRTLAGWIWSSAGPPGRRRMVPQDGLEPPTSRIEAGSSDPLSYWGMVRTAGLEPASIPLRIPA
jgi:hypothetical protein